MEFSPQCDLDHTPYPKAQGTMQKRRQKDGKRQRTGWERLFIGYDRDFVLMYSQWLRLPSKGQTFQYSSLEEGVGLWSLSVPEEPLAIEVCWWKKTQFSSGMWALITAHVLVDEPSPIHIQISLTEVSAFKKGYKIWEWNMVEERERN